MNKYIYIKETGQVAGPLQMEKPERDTTASLRDSTDYIERNIVNWYKHLKTLPRIDVIGEHFFKDGQILESRKDIILATRSSCEIEAAIPVIPIEKATEILNKTYQRLRSDTPTSLEEKQVQKEKDFEPGARSINEASVEEAAISYLETLYIKDYVRQRLKEADWPLAWTQILRAFEKGAEYASIETEHLRQENKTLIQRIKELEEENRYLKTSITHT